MDVSPEYDWVNIEEAVPEPDERVRFQKAGSVWLYTGTFDRENFVWLEDNGDEIDAEATFWRPMASDPLL